MDVPARDTESAMVELGQDKEVALFIEALAILGPAFASHQLL